MNRIEIAISKMAQTIQEGLSEGRFTPLKIANMDKTLSMDSGEHARFQELKSLALCDGTLTVDEANHVYALLGPSVENFNRQEVAVKVILTKLFQELLTKRLRKAV